MWAIPRSQTRSQDPDCLKLCHLGQIEMCKTRSKNRYSNTGCSKIGQPFDVYKYMYIYIQIYVYIRIYIYNFFMWFPSKHRLELRRTSVASPGPLPPKTAPQWPSTPSPDTPRGGERSVAGEGVSLLRGASSPKNMWANFLVMVFWNISKSY